MMVAILTLDWVSEACGVCWNGGWMEGGESLVPAQSVRKTKSRKRFLLADARFCFPKSEKITTGDGLFLVF